ncbi:Uncharacterized protein PBTT_04475 [Plasmodiophora brassicae]|nr:hypothetical protein PBRA_009403 [Plasmodiophora brassicae]
MEVVTDDAVARALVNDICARLNFNLSSQAELYELLVTAASLVDHVRRYVAAGDRSATSAEAAALFALVERLRPRDDPGSEHKFASIELFIRQITSRYPCKDP